MSESFLGEIRIFGFGFAPRGTLLCDGQILPINQNQSLYSLLGTTYGGDGRTTFGLPELRGRVPIHFDSAHPRGQRAGEQNVTLTDATIPAHTHTLSVKNANGTEDTPGGNSLANSPGGDTYRTPIPTTNLVNLASGTVGNTGGGGAHENQQPYQAISYTIATQGIFPSRN